MTKGVTVLKDTYNNAMRLPPTTGTPEVPHNLERTVSILRERGNSMEKILEELMILSSNREYWTLEDLNYAISTNNLSISEIIKNELDNKGAKSLGIKMYEELQNFISTLLILFYLHLMFPGDFKMKANFKEWAVLPNSHNMKLYNNLRYLREFAAKYQGLSTRLELGSSWLEYANDKYIFIAYKLSKL